MDYSKEISEKFESWMILEIMGHRKLAGYVTEEEHAGIIMLRIDIPNNKTEYTTQYYHPNSIFCITPINESDARKLSKAWRPQPFDYFDLHKESKIKPDYDPDEMPF